MIFTDAYRNLSEIYRAMGTRFIKRKAFFYKKHRVTLFYTCLDEETDIMRLMIRGEKDIVYVPFYFTCKENGEVMLRSYFPRVAYDVLKRSLFCQDQYRTTPFLEHVYNVLARDSASDYQRSTSYEFDDEGHEATVQADPSEYVYVSHLRYSHVGEQTEVRIKALYANPYAILKKLRKLHCTVVFTWKVSQKHDLLALIEDQETKTDFLRL